MLLSRCRLDSKTLVLPFNMLWTSRFVDINQSVVAYLDDFIVFSKKISDHFHHLRKIFERCQKYGISLNPKKSIFEVSEGNLLGYIIAKSGIKVGPMRVKLISQICFPMNKKAMQSFLWKVTLLGSLSLIMHKLLSLCNK